ncbi:hypothetical protein FXQ12_22995 [Salmonella enterica]|nr:hypothetical protein [Salmonella enterica]ECC9414795.1 hypothetical protein [Salmonella enterica subsp. enterica]EHF1448519.1 hypothetical protein [Salmonella enterica subsp. enterica serovar 4,5,12:b:-]EHG1528595.1 hypothetical protein [Salmonella enterica subsp. enterica serovar 4,[5],12:b:-]ECD8848737.1 hypothetical protein [Salmonella enterica subsp. enterica]
MTPIDAAAKILHPSCTDFTLEMACQVFGRTMNELTCSL